MDRPMIKNHFSEEFQEQPTAEKGSKTRLLLKMLLKHSMHSEFATTKYKSMDSTLLAKMYRS